KNNSKRSTPKSNKTIINWSEYNKALAARGNISVYISEATAEKAFRKSRKTHKVGHPEVYRDSLIELILTLRELFRLPLRQSSGFAGNILLNMGVKRQLPDYTTLSRRMKKMEVEYCNRIKQRKEKAIVLLLDSSGFKVFGEGDRI
ncbi:MAG: transposase, partial [Elusimicrobiota bacterium]|nr:transposase [Elusimicrobiota bacterium]